MGLVDIEGKAHPTHYTSKIGGRSRGGSSLTTTPTNHVSLPIMRTVRIMVRAGFIYTDGLDAGWLNMIMVGRAEYCVTLCSVVLAISVGAGCGSNYSQFFIILS